MMGKYIGKRLLQLIPILFAITFLSFAMMRLAGSDVVTQKMQNTGSVVSEEVMENYLCTDIDRMEKIALQVPLSAEERPIWDKKILKKIGFNEVKTDKEIWKYVWSKEEKLNYQSTPMFMISAIK